MHRFNAGVAILQVTSQICLVDGPDQPGKFGFKCGKVRCIFFGVLESPVMRDCRIE